MKKNFSVNIGSRIFHIDEDAYERLNNYLGRLRTFFGKEEGCDEIITDIEMRIAELLEQRKSSGPVLVSLQDINEVIASMGEPDEMSDSKQKTAGEKTSGKLFRDPDNRQIGGVCAGIAAWLGVTPLWIRVAVIVFTLFYGTGVIIYLILWLILPEAKTTSEKLEMQRQSINIDTLRNEVASAGSGLKKTGNSVLHTIGTVLRLCTEIISRIIRWTLQLLRRTAGAVILIIALSLFAGVSIMFFMMREPLEFEMYHLAPSTLSSTLDWLVPLASIRWQVYVSFSMLFVGTVGLLMLIGLRLMLKWPPIRWLAISILGILIFFGLIIGGATAIQYTNRVSGQISSSSQRQTISFKSKQIQLLPGSPDRGQYWMPITGTGQAGRYNDVLGDIRLSVRPAPADSIIITTIKTATSIYETEASNFTRNITYTYELKDSTLMVNPYFKFPLRDGLHYQKAELIIGIPVNTKVLIGDKMSWMIYSSSDFAGDENDSGTYMMTNAGLQKVLSK